jgi:hypothetical protein
VDSERCALAKARQWIDLTNVSTHVPVRRVIDAINLDRLRHLPKLDGLDTTFSRDFYMFLRSLRTPFISGPKNCRRAALREVYRADNPWVSRPDERPALDC